MIAKRILACVLAASLALIGISAVRAQETDGEKQAELLQHAVDALQKVLQPGPINVKLGNQATWHLPQGAGFVRQPEAGAWASVAGDGTYADLINPTLLGIAIPMSEDNWVTFIHYHAGTRIADDDARDWDAEALLGAIKASTEADNAAHRQKDEPELEVRGWLEKPRYDSASHKLIWAVNSGEKGGDPDEGTTRVHAYVLARDGYFDLTMVSPAAEAASHLTMVESQLASLELDANAQYDKGPASGTKERSITTLVTTLPSGLADRAVAFARANGVTLVVGLLILIALIVAGLVLLRRRSLT